MGAFLTTAIVGLGVMGAATSIAGAKAASTEAKYNAKVKENQAAMIGSAKEMANYQANQQMGQVRGTTIARIAKSGLMLSGSPLAVMLDTQAQMEIDSSINRYNYDVQQSYTLSEASAYKRQARTAMVGGYTGAFTQLLQTGVYYGMSQIKPQTGVNTGTKTATKAGKL